MLNERVDNVNVDKLSEKKLFNIYFNLFKTNLTESIPIEKLETWLNYLFSLFETKETKNLELTNEKFEKLIKKSVRQMLIHDSLNCLQTFVNKVTV